MENKNVKLTGIIKFDVLENDDLKISIQCSEFKYLELLGILESIKTHLINDHTNKL